MGMRPPPAAATSWARSLISTVAGTGPKAPLLRRRHRGRAGSAHVAVQRPISGRFHDECSGTTRERLSPLADPFLGLGHPLQGLEVDKRPWAPPDLGRTQAEEEFLGAVEGPHPDGA